MAEPMKLGATDIVIGIAVLVVAFVVVFLAAGALNLPAPQWVLAAVAAAVGIIVWFAILRRRKA